MIECPSLGELTKLKIGHNNKGIGSGWYLTKVIVDDTLINKVYEFVCDRWLAEDEGIFYDQIYIINKRRRLFI
jgi:hypothetical protein